MDLSIIIVNWNSKEYALKCIASVVAGVRGLAFEIIVIDSGSFDGCEEMLRNRYPQVRFIQSPANLGFAKANNHAFSVSTGDCILFLNPDTEVKDAAINVLYSALKSLPYAGVVGAKLLNSDGSIQTSCIQAFPTILNQALDSDVLRRTFPRSHLWGTAPLVSNVEHATEVDVISGACLMLSRELFENVACFDSNYFMYYEDVDLCFKIHRTGKKNYYVPSAVVVHHGGVSSARNEVSTFSSVMMLESQRRFFCKTRPPGYTHLNRVIVICVSMLRVTTAFLLWLAGSLTNKGPRWKAALSKWSARFRWALGLEGWVRNYGT